MTLDRFTYHWYEWLLPGHNCTVLLLLTTLFVALQVLVAYGAPLFVENSAKETPCDCAEKSGHSDIALYLESKMVFSVIIISACYRYLLL